MSTSSFLDESQGTFVSVKREDPTTTADRSEAVEIAYLAPPDQVEADPRSLWEILLSRAQRPSPKGILELLIGETELVLSQLSHLIDQCLEPLPKRKRGRKPLEPVPDEEEPLSPFVEIGRALAIALGIQQGKYRRKALIDINYAAVLDFDRLILNNVSLANRHSLDDDIYRPKKARVGRPRKDQQNPKANTDAADVKPIVVADSAATPASNVPFERSHRASRRIKTDPDYVYDQPHHVTNKEIKSESGGLTEAVAAMIVVSDDDVDDPDCERKVQLRTGFFAGAVDDEDDDDDGEQRVRGRGRPRGSGGEKKERKKRKPNVQYCREQDKKFYCIDEECTEKDTAYESKSEARKHYKELHVKTTKEVQCIQCELIFPNYKERNEHLKSSHDKNLKCSECDQKFWMEKNRNIHFQKVHAPKTAATDELDYLCPKCGKKLQSKRWIDRHEAKCDGLLVRHPQWKKENNEYFCTVEDCPIQHGFSCMYGLRMHFHADHVPEEERFFACEYCDERFAYKTNRNKHVLLKHVKRFQCDFCGRSFGAKDKMQSHRMVHTGERPYPCDKCNYRAAKKYNLDAHKQVKHGDFGAKSFYCELCGKLFVTAGRVRRHIKMVHEEGRGGENTQRGQRKAAQAAAAMAAAQAAQVAVAQAADDTIMGETLGVGEEDIDEKTTIQVVEHVLDVPETTTIEFLTEENVTTEIAQNEKGEYFTLI